MVQRLITDLFGDRRKAVRTVLIGAMLALLAAGFLIPGEELAKPNLTLGATYPIMTDTGVAYTTLARAIRSWTMLPVFGLLFLLLRRRDG